MNNIGLWDACFYITKLSGNYTKTGVWEYCLKIHCYKEEWQKHSIPELLWFVQISFYLLKWGNLGQLWYPVFIWIASSKWYLLGRSKQIISKQFNLQKNEAYIHWPDETLLDRKKKKYCLLKSMANREHVRCKNLKQINTILTCQWK